jgi:hypothetical protein
MNSLSGRSAEHLKQGSLKIVAGNQPHQLGTSVQRFRDPFSLHLQEMVCCATSVGHLYTCSKSFSHSYCL